ncbi:protein lin-54 homolog [Diadema antillarum]|uniref:protein lin-54 homolog n=1 Tax=Diadema antillarum TaxID=105358 RepID=UPI003A889351
MSSADENMTGETNGGTEAPENIIIKTEDEGPNKAAVENSSTVTVNATAAVPISQPTPVQVLTPQMLANLSGQRMIIQSDGDQKALLQAVKRALPASASSGSEQNITKVVITRTPGTKAPSASAATASGPSTGTKIQILQTADGKQIIPSGSPIKVITVSQGSSIPKNIVLSSSPGKQTGTLANKIALPPAKSPGKTITLASPTTPKKIAPASAPVGQTILVKGTTGNPGTITLSSGAVAKVVNVISTAGASSVPGIAAASPVPVQIHPSGQAQQQLAPGVTAIRPAGNLTTPANVQAVNMSGTKFPYVRLVTVSTNATTTTTQAKSMIQLANAKPIAPAPAVTTVSSAGSSSQRTVNVPIAPAQGSAKSTAPAQSGNQPRFIMPANAQVKIINPGKLLQGTTLMSAGGNLLQGYAVIPTQYLAQQQVGNQSSQAVIPAASSKSSGAPNQPPAPPPPAKHTTSNGLLATDASGNRPRKPCNCTKSACLKLYCDCFANGEFCRNCNCHNCLNNLEHEEERTKAVKACLDRNPLAFHPKIGKGQNGESNRRHNKGCNCKRSGCLKNYCECYEAKILCSSICKCVGCKNFEESPERKTLMHLADAAEVRVQQQTAARTKLSSQLQDYPTKTKEFSDAGERLPFSFITKEVAEATLQCLMAQADESERSSHPSNLAESLILEEFGRCILQVIHSASKTKGMNPE